MSGYCVNMSWDSDMLWYANMSWDCVNMSICREIPTYQHIYILWWNHWSVCRNWFHQWIPFNQSELMRNWSGSSTDWQGLQISWTDPVALGTRGDTLSYCPHRLYAAHRPYPNPRLRTTHLPTHPKHCQQTANNWPHWLWLKRRFWTAKMAVEIGEIGDKCSKCIGSIGLRISAIDCQNGI